MRLLSSWLVVPVSLLLGLTNAAGWSFEDATLTISTKGSGVGSGTKHSLKPQSPLNKIVQLGSSDTLKILLKITDNNSPKRPHQAFLTLADPSTGLEDAYLFSVKDNGKATLELVNSLAKTALASTDNFQTYKDLPTQFLSSKQPLKASITLASFGSSDPFESQTFTLSPDPDQGATSKQPTEPLRYGKLKEIHHIFKADPTSPPIFISLIFVAQALITLPILIGVWASLGANLNHLPEALGSAPISHATFFGSIVGLEAIFFMYYTHWKLYHLLPAAGVVGLIAFLSGSRALSEVQTRRFKGKR